MLSKRMMVEIKSVSDIAAIMMWRDEVIEAVFGQSPEKGLIEANRDYYTRHIADGSHLAIAASVGGKDAGCGGICFHEELPSPDNPTGRCAYLMNIYVREAFRHAGIGASIIRHLVGEARKRGCGKIYLETTDMAETLYGSIGFEPMKGMLRIKDNL